MSASYLPRTIEPVIQKAVGEFPAVVLVGPRQSGKTTLLNKLFGKTHQIISLEPPDVRAAAAADPRGFLALYPPPVVFDEVQYVPELLPYIKEVIDANRSHAGAFILTGSQNLLLMQQVSESLAGRAAVLKLLPLSRHELLGQPQRPLPWDGGQGEPLDTAKIWPEILRGYYPEVANNPQRDARMWLASYVQTYLERDVRNLRNVGDLTLFQTFLRALAARSAQILNLSDLARDVGVSVNTAKEWLSILEASFQILILRPYYANIGKRLIKSPKVYFLDTGLLCYLVGLREVEHAMSGPMGGAIFENLVVAEIYKQSLHQGIEPAMYFWRTANGNEVDIVIERFNELLPIEVKLSATPRADMAKEIHSFRDGFPAPAQPGRPTAGPGYVIHNGNMLLPLGSGVLALPLSEL